MGKPTTKTELLLQIRNELNKEHIAFDFSGLPIKIYTAPIYAVDGTPCAVTEYIYHAGLPIIKGRKEGYDVWSSSFEDTIFLLDDLGNDLTDNLGNQLTE